MKSEQQQQQQELWKDEEETSSSRRGCGMGGSRSRSWRNSAMHWEERERVFGRPLISDIGLSYYLNRLPAIPHDLRSPVEVKSQQH